MKVGNGTQTGILETLTKATQTKTTKEKGLEGKVEQNTTDKVELSSRQEEIKKLTERVKAAPDIRQDKVAQIQQEIEAQTYNVRGEMVAKSIMKSQLLDQVL